MLVKANSHGSSSSQSDCDDRSYLSANSLERAGMDAIVDEEGTEVLSLESPPRTGARTHQPEGGQRARPPMELWTGTPTRARGRGRDG